MRPSTVRLAVPAAVLSLALAGCAPAPIYKPTPNTAAVPPSQVAREPERYGSSDVIWGGRIVQVKNYADHSEIEVLAYPLDSSQRPKANDTGNGRFIAAMPGYVESLDFPAGGLVTFAGRLNGTRTGNVGQASYTFPLVSVNQSHVWTAKEMQGGHPNISFGVGVGVIR
ncbi:Slp family lipoprotein [Luteibacter aegosomaticola]|jgi:outer membrane lipoprotein|uniref:Slp family lipoprotein n=1 Tax=Luteibacter aegosomaticola TaxID=2911538 RepID=UPI001FFA8B7C|nr:Slp family lipoprotein [Luteibacter aegosomaticola]UPG91698.1 Slp family lipoprotein [Luteibacter aegosomaticola]